MDGQTPEAPQAPALTGLDERIDALKEAGVLDGAGLLHEPGTGHFATASQREQVIAHADQILDRLDGSQLVDQGDLARQTQQAEREVARKDAVRRMAQALSRGKISEYSAGPDYIKATGLSHEDVQRLGFSGFADLADAGRAKNAERAERQARIAELTAKQAKRNKRKAAARAWRDELDANKAARDAGAKRVEGIAYRLMLEHGGELGLKRNPELAEQLREEAIARAKAEGHNVSDMEPRYYPVPDKTSKTAQATADALRAFDEGMYGRRKPDTDSGSDSDRQAPPEVYGGYPESFEYDWTPQRPFELLDEAYAENEAIDAERTALAEARDAYVKLSAQMRGGHLGRVAGGRLHRLMEWLSGGINGPKSDELDAQVSRARDAYTAAFRAVFNRRGAHLLPQGEAGELSPEDHKLLLHVRLDELAGLEGNILTAQQTQIEGQKFGRPKNRIARKWAESGRVGKVLMVAVPAAALGLTGGAAAAALGIGGIVSTFTGLGFVYGGRKVGHGIAGVASRNYASTDIGRGELVERARQVQEAFRSEVATAGDNWVDHTVGTERLTTESVQANQHRRKVAGAVGAVAAGVSFFGSRLLLDGLHHGAQHAANASGSQHTGQTGHGTGNGSVHGGNHGGGAHAGVHHGGSSLHYNQYPWDVAHQATPGHEFDSIHQAMHAANQGGNAHYHLQHVGNTLQVYDGNHALDAAQQAHFNEMMAKVLGWK